MQAKVSQTHEARPATHGEAYARNYNGYRDRLKRMAASTKPIHDEVARLQAQGMSTEQAWAEVLKKVRS